MAGRSCTRQAPAARARQARAWGGRCAGGAETPSASPPPLSARFLLPQYLSSTLSLRFSPLSTTQPPPCPPPKLSRTTTCPTHLLTSSTLLTTDLPSTPTSTTPPCTTLRHLPRSRSLLQPSSTPLLHSLLLLFPLPLSSRFRWLPLLLPCPRTPLLS